MLEAVLSNCDFKYRAVISGEGALKPDRSDNFDIVLSDIQLHEMKGIETMLAIRKLSVRRFPFIAITAFACNLDRQRLMDAGFDEYIAKPFEFEELIGKIQHVLMKYGTYVCDIEMW